MKGGDRQALRKSASGLHYFDALGEIVWVIVRGGDDVPAAQGLFFHDLESREELGSRIPLGDVQIAGLDRLLLAISIYVHAEAQALEVDDLAVSKSPDRLIFTHHDSLVSLEPRIFRMK
jgi:hypothetical protein